MQLQVVVDRIVEEQAVLLYRPDEKKEILWPLELLPEEVREGHILNIEVNIDEAETRQAEERVGKLIQRLKNKNK